MAVEVFEQGSYQSTVAGSVNFATQAGHLLVVGSQGEDVYVQQVATFPQSLLVADNASFLNAKIVKDVDRFQKLVFTSGGLREDSGVQQDNDSVYEFSLTGLTVTTRFVFPEFSSNGLPSAGGANLGTLLLRQADGSLSSWGLNSFNGRVTIVSGPVGTGPAGHVVPAVANIDVIDAIDPNGIGALDDSISLGISWAMPAARPSSMDLSPFASLPTIESGTYGTILPSARPQAVFTLPNALGNGSNGILPGSLTGFISIAGGRYPFRVDAFDGTRLVFGGGVDSAGYESTLFVRTRSDAVGDDFHTVTGRVDLLQGRIVLDFAGARAADETSGRFPQDPGYVTIDAEYGVSVQGNGIDGAPGSVTFFAGQDITREIYVDLPTPGATVNVNSPLIMSPTIAGGDTTLRATNVNIGASMLVNDRLDIGQSVLPRLVSDNTLAYDTIAGNRFDRVAPNAVRTAGAVAEIVGGEVVRLYTPPGLFGIGYDQDDLPGGCGH
jgi:hypothetical protein